MAFSTNIVVFSIVVFTIFPFSFNSFHSLSVKFINWEFQGFSKSMTPVCEEFNSKTLSTKCSDDFVFLRTNLKLYIMLEFNYYFVTSKVNGFPYFTTCAVIDDVFFRISNLEAFLTDGRSGISDEKIEYSSFKLVTSQNFSI